MAKPIDEAIRDLEQGNTTISREEITQGEYMRDQNIMGGNGAYIPPPPKKPASAGVEAGISTGRNTKPLWMNVPGYDQHSPGSVSVANPQGTPTQQPPSTTPSMNLGWNGGAHSEQSLSAGWIGRITFDVPDVQGSRPIGAAVGLAPVQMLPVSVRDGYAHLRYGLVFTGSTLKVIHDGMAVFSTPYAGVLSDRGVDSDTDKAVALLYGDNIKWIVNGTTLHFGAWSMPGDFALDATLYSALDSVDNPAFRAGDWGSEVPELESGSLNFALPGLVMDADASRDDELVIALGPLAARFSEGAYADIAMSLPGLTMNTGGQDGAVLVIGPMGMIASDSMHYAELTGSLVLEFAAGAGGF